MLLKACSFLFSVLQYTVSFNASGRYCCLTHRPGKSWGTGRTAPFTAWSALPSKCWFCSVRGIAPVFPARMSEIAASMALYAVLDFGAVLTRNDCVCEPEYAPGRLTCSAASTAALTMGMIWARQGRHPLHARPSAFGRRMAGPPPPKDGRDSGLPHPDPELRMDFFEKRKQCRSVHRRPCHNALRSLGKPPCVLTSHIEAAAAFIRRGTHSSTALMDLRTSPPQPVAISARTPSLKGNRRPRSAESVSIFEEPRVQSLPLEQA